LPNGRLVSPEHYFAMLRSGHSEEELRAANVHPVHPAFRIICTAKPPQSSGPMDWLGDELLALFLFVGLFPLSDEDHRVMLRGMLGEQVLDGLLELGAALRTASEKEPARFRPLRLSTRRFLQISRYATAGLQEEGHALGRALRPPFALLPEGAQQLVVGMLQEAGKKGLPEVKLNVKALAAKATTAVHVQREEWLRVAQEAVRALRHRSRAELKEFVVVSDGVLQIGNVRSRLLNPQRPELVPMAPFVEIPQHREVLRQMLLDWEIGHHMLLIGPQGVGKNKLADHLLELLRAEREYLQLHRDSNVSSLVSAPSLVGGVLIWGDSPLVRALKYGRVLVVDEADKAPLEVVCVLKALVEDGEYALPDGRLVSQRGGEGNSEVIVPGDGFRVVVLANQPGFPFLGNNFYSVCGDIFAAHALECPDIQSEAIVAAFLRAHS